MRAADAAQDARTEPAAAMQQGLSTVEDVGATKQTRAEPTCENKPAPAAATSVADKGSDALSVFSFL